MKRPGFTLIELLIAITILAIISSIGYVTYNKAQRSARDFRRKDDLRSLKTALELYNQTNKHYPCTGGLSTLEYSNQPLTAGQTDWLYDKCSMPANALLAPNYINTLPIDPNNLSQQIYRYGTVQGGNCPSSSDGAGFILMAILENSADPATLGAKNYTLCDGEIISTANWGPITAQAYILSNN